MAKYWDSFLSDCRRTMRSRSPSPIFIPDPSPSGGTGGSAITIPEVPSSAPAVKPPSPVGPIPVIREFIHPSSSLPKEVIPLPPIVPRIPSPPLVDPSPFVPIPILPSPPPVESPCIPTPLLPLVPWGMHRRQYSSMEQYEPPPMIIDNPVDIPLPESPPSRGATPIIPAPWNRSPTPEDIPLPPIKHIGPLSLDLIPLPWDIPPMPKATPQPSPPVELSPEFPPIVSMTHSHTKPLLPRHPDSRTLSRDRPTPPEWEAFQPSPVTGK